MPNKPNLIVSSPRASPDSLTSFWFRRRTSTATLPSTKKSGDTFPSGSKTTDECPRDLRYWSASFSESSIEKYPDKSHQSGTRLRVPQLSRQLWISVPEFL
jgi:hypothetical protein